VFALALFYRRPPGSLGNDDPTNHPRLHAHHRLSPRQHPCRRDRRDRRARHRSPRRVRRRRHRGPPRFLRCVAAPRARRGLPTYHWHDARRGPVRRVGAVHPSRQSWLGVRSASDTEDTWPFYGRLVGAYVRRHPAIQAATVNVVDWRNPCRGYVSRPPSDEIRSHDTCSSQQERLQKCRASYCGWLTMPSTGPRPNQSATCCSVGTRPSPSSMTRSPVPES